MLSTVIKVRRYYRNTGNFFAILNFYKSGCWGFLGFNAKFVLHIPFDSPNVNALKVASLEMQMHKDYSLHDTSIIMKYS